MYQVEGAVYEVRTLPKRLSCPQIRTILSAQFGTFLRHNGHVLFTDAQLNNGDVLECHAAGLRGELNLSLTSPRVQISLQAALPVPTPVFDVDSSACLLLQTPFVHEALCDAPTWAVDYLPVGLDLHPATYEALHTQHEVDHAGSVRLELYVDGATWQHQSAWAVVIVEQSDAGPFFRGCLSGVTQIRTAAADWIGAIAHTNIEAEFSPMAVASAFALFASHDLPVCIRPDLALSHQVTACTVARHQDHALTSVLHALGTMFTSGISIEEVRAHASHPWNELVDGVAKWTARTGQSIGQVHWQPLHDLASSKSDCNWNWLLQAPRSSSALFPVLHGCSVWQPEPSQVLIPARVHRASCSDHEYAVSFSAATHNALALDLEDEATRLPGPRSIRLDQQFHERKCALIGLQETRTPEGRRITDHYAIFSSGFAQCGRSRHFGCELWLHRSIPLAKAPDGTALTLTHFQPIVLHATARVLLMRLQGPFDLFIAAGHAPCLSADRPLDQLQQWWAAFTDQLQRLPLNAPLIVCLDANAPLASSRLLSFSTCIKRNPLTLRDTCLNNFCWRIVSSSLPPLHPIVALAPHGVIHVGSFSGVIMYFVNSVAWALLQIGSVV